MKMMMEVIVPKSQACFLFSLHDFDGSFA